MRGLDLARGAAIFDAPGFQLPRLATEDHTRGLRAGDDRKVWPLLRLAFQEGLICARPFTPARSVLRKRHRACRPAPLASIVVTAGDARSHRCLDEILGDGEHWGTTGDPKRAGAVVRRRINRDLAAGRETLAFAKIGQHLGVAPSDGTAHGPGVEISRMASDVRHVIEAGRATQHFASGNGDAPANQPQTGAARVGRVHPIGGRVPLHGSGGHRHRRHLGRPLAGFDQRHPARRIL